MNSEEPPDWYRSKTLWKRYSVTYRTNTTTAATAREVQPGVYEISGRCEIADLNETFNLDLPESDEYQTLAGFILNNLGEIPSQGDTFDIKGMTFSIIKKSATRLELIRITVNRPEED